MDDDDIGLIIKLLFGAMFLVAVAPIVIRRISAAVPPLTVGSAGRQSGPAAYGQTWYDPYTQKRYVYSPIEGIEEYEVWARGR